MTFQGEQNQGGKFNKDGVVFQTGSNITGGSHTRDMGLNQPKYIPKKVSSQRPNAQTPVLPQEQPRSSVCYIINKNLNLSFFMKENKKN